MRPVSQIRLGGFEQVVAAEAEFVNQQQRCGTVGGKHDGGTFAAFDVTFAGGYWLGKRRRWLED